MEENIRLEEGIVLKKTQKVLCISIIVLCFLCFLLVLFLSCKSTAQLKWDDFSSYAAEEISFLKDDPIKNIFIVFLIVGIMGVIYFILPKPDSKAIIICEIILHIVTISVGLFYIKSVKPIQFLDAKNIMIIANDIASGNQPSTLCYFLQYYPHLSGLLLYFLLLIKIFGAGNITSMAAVNVGMLLVCNRMTIASAKIWLKDNKSILMYILLLIIFIQPVLYCALVYTPMPSYMFSIIGYYCILCFLKEHKKSLIFFAALSIGVGAMFRPSAVIYAIASFGLLFLLCLYKKKYSYIVGGMLCIAAALIMPRVSVIAAEQVTGIDLSIKNAPALNWLTIGLRESNRAPGWWSDPPYEPFVATEEEMEQAVRADLKRRLELFKNSAYRRSFFARKIVSTWDEPTFQSVFVSRAAVGNYPLPDYIEDFFFYSLKGKLFNCWEYELLVFYMFFLLGLCVFIRKIAMNNCEDSIVMVSYPLVLLGVFLYHVFSEVKSQYVLLYIPLLLAVAAQGVDLSILWHNNRWISGRPENNRENN